MLEPSVHALLTLLMTIVGVVWVATVHRTGETAFHYWTSLSYCSVSLLLFLTEVVTPGSRTECVLLVLTAVVGLLILAGGAGLVTRSLGNVREQLR